MPQIVTHYLEMLEPPDGAPPATPPGAALARLNVNSAEYCELYRAVGGPWNWTRRLEMQAADLDHLLSEAGVEVMAPCVHDQIAGLIEVDRRTEDVEIVYFGLRPEYIGQGLGKWLLRALVDDLWKRGASRIWLHTCNRDHPAALPNYLRAGFVKYDERRTEM